MRATTRWRRACKEVSSASWPHACLVLPLAVLCAHSSILSRADGPSTGCLAMRVFVTSDHSIFASTIM